MRQASRRMVAVVAVAAFVTACILIVGSGGFTFNTLAANGTLTPWAYLPFVARQPTPTPTPISCSTVPTLISPANGSHLDSLIPLFAWDSGNDPNVDWLYLEIGRDPNLADWAGGLSCGDDDCIRGIHRWRVSDNLDPNALYFWRAYLMCGSTQGPYSEVWRFTTGIGGTVLPAPSLRSPADGSTVPGPTVTLRWSSVSGAVEYRAATRHLASGHTFSEIVQGTKTEFRWSPGRGGIFEWWVIPRNDYAWGTSSTYWRFTIDPGVDQILSAPSSPYSPDLLETHCSGSNSAAIALNKRYIR